MTDPNISSDDMARLAAEPEPNISPQRRRWLKGEMAQLYGMPPESVKPQCWDTGHNWTDR